MDFGSIKYQWDRSRMNILYMFARSSYNRPDVRASDNMGLHSVVKLILSDKFGYTFWRTCLEINAARHINILYVEYRENCDVCNYYSD
jgi:hypothetical protein